MTNYIGNDPAFPGETNSEYFKGMTIRQYFVAQAMIGLQANSCYDLEDKEIAKFAVKLADACLVLEMKTRGEEGKLKF